MSTVKDIYTYLPPRLAGEIEAGAKRAGVDTEASPGRGAFVTEVRLRRDRPCSLTLSDGRNVPLAVLARRSELSAALARMTENSLHSHAASLRQGYIRLPDGSRVGVCGRAVTERSQGDSVLTNIGEITSMCIRISHTVCGVSDGIYGRLRSRRFEGGALFYGPPACGKTTLLREIAIRAASGEEPMRVAVIDSRGELGCGEHTDRGRRENADSGIGAYRDSDGRCVRVGDIREQYGAGLCIGYSSENALIDRLDGYPKAEGIAQATRVLSPELIVCDEIGGEAEARAILEAQNTGVPLIASAHASSYEALMRRPHIRALVENAVFSECIGIARDDRAPGGLRFTVAGGERTGTVLVPGLTRPRGAVR